MYGRKMKKQEIVILALKLLGIYFFISGLASLGQSTFLKGIEDLSNFSIYSGSLVLLTSGLILFFGTKCIGQDKPDESSVKFPHTFRNFTGRKVLWGNELIGIKLRSLQRR